MYHGLLICRVKDELEKGQLSPQQQRKEEEETAVESDEELMPVKLCSSKSSTLHSSQSLCTEIHDSMVYLSYLLALVFVVFCFVYLLCFLLREKQALVLI